MKYIDAIIEIAQKIQITQKDSLTSASKICAGVIAKKRPVLLFGAGHSSLPCQEAFPRIGSIPGFIQITEPVFGFNGFVTGKGGQKQMSFLEQTEGFAEVILSNYALQKGDCLIIVSNSGINALPLELCLAASQRGVTTISLSSFLHASANRPKHTNITQRLHELSDIAIDNCTPEGDALIPILETHKSGGSSTIANMLIINSIVVETTRILEMEGYHPLVYPSHNVSESEHKVAILEKAIFTAHKQFLSSL